MQVDYSEGTPEERNLGSEEEESGDPVAGVNIYLSGEEVSSSEEEKDSSEEEKLEGSDPTDLDNLNYFSDHMNRNDNLTFSEEIETKSHYNFSDGEASDI